MVLRNVWRDKMNGSGETGCPTPQEHDTAGRRPWTAPRIIDSDYVRRTENHTPAPNPEIGLPSTISGTS